MVTAIVGRLGVGGEEVEVVLGGGIFDSDYAGFAERVEDTACGPRGPGSAGWMPPRSSARPCSDSTPSGRRPRPRASPVGGATADPA